MPHPGLTPAHAWTPPPKNSFSPPLITLASPPVRVGCIAYAASNFGLCMCVRKGRTRVVCVKTVSVLCVCVLCAYACVKSSVCLLPGSVPPPELGRIRNARAHLRSSTRHCAVCCFGGGQRVHSHTHTLRTPERTS